MKTISTRITDLEEAQAVRILSDYLFKEKLFTKICPLQKKPLDLHYILYNVSDNMYSAKSSGCPGELIDSGKGGKKFKFIKAVKSYEMRNKFIKRLEYKGIHEFKLERNTLKRVIDQCLKPEAQAVLKSFLYPNTRLEAFGPELAVYEKRINRLNKTDKFRARQRAVYQIIDNLVMLEMELV